MGENRNMNNGKPKSVPPLFFLDKEAPEDIDRIDVLEAAEKLTRNPAAVICATRSGGLWKVYAAALEHKTILASHGHLSVQNKNTKECKNVKLYVQNPFNLRSENGEEIPGTRLNIAGLPLSVSDEDLKASLQDLGVKMRGNIVWEKVKKRDDTLHPHWITGRRYTFIDLPKVSLSNKLNVGSFTCYLNYKEQDKSILKCFVCGKEGHRKSSPLCEGRQAGKQNGPLHGEGSTSRKKIACYTCGKEGHKRYSPLCEGPPTQGAPSKAEAVVHNKGDFSGMEGQGTGTSAQDNTDKADVSDVLGESIDAYSETCDSDEEDSVWGVKTNKSSGEHQTPMRVEISVTQVESMIIEELVKEAIVNDALFSDDDNMNLSKSETNDSVAQHSLGSELALATVESMVIEEIVNDAVSETMGKNDDQNEGGTPKSVEGAEAEKRVDDCIKNKSVSDNCDAKNSNENEGDDSGESMPTEENCTDLGVRQLEGKSESNDVSGEDEGGNDSGCKPPKTFDFGSLSTFGKKKMSKKEKKKRRKEKQKKINDCFSPANGSVVESGGKRGLTSPEDALPSQNRRKL